MRLVTAVEVTADLIDWRYLLGGSEATFRAPTFSDAARLVGEIGRAAADANHHPDVDLRYPGLVHVSLTTHSEGGVTDADVAMARTISDLAARIGAHVEEANNRRIEFAIDALDIDAVRPFWKALLDYV